MWVFLYFSGAIWNSLRPSRKNPEKQDAGYRPPGAVGDKAWSCKEDTNMFAHLRCHSSEAQMEILQQKGCLFQYFYIIYCIIGHWYLCILLQAFSLMLLRKSCHNSVTWARGSNRDDSAQSRISLWKVAMEITDTRLWLLVTQWHGASLWCGTFFKLCSSAPITDPRALFEEGMERRGWGRGSQLTLEGPVSATWRTNNLSFDWPMGPSDKGHLIHPIRAPPFRACTFLSRLAPTWQPFELPVLLDPIFHGVLWGRFGGSPLLRILRHVSKGDDATCEEGFWALSLQTINVLRSLFDLGAHPPHLLENSCL